MSRTVLFGLLLLALGAAVFVRWGSPARRGERAVVAQPESPAPEPEARVLVAPAAPEESRATAAPSPAAPGEEIPPLAGPLELPVHVTDPEGKPLADASVSVFADQTESAVLFNGKTDGDGACRIPAPDRPRFARIEHDGFAHKHVLIQGTEPLEVELARAVRLAGRVRDAVTRAAVAGAKIHWQSRRDGYGCEECYPEPIVSDARGNYAIAELEQSSEPVYFSIEAEGYPRSSEAFMTAGTESHPPHTALALAHDFELRPGLEVAGVVLDHATGAPLAGASIAEQGGWATSDEAGRFHMLAGGTGTTTLRAELAGYCGVSVPLALEAREPVQIRLVKGTTIAGHVHDPAGRALAGAEIRASARPEEDRSLPRELGLPPEWQWHTREEYLEAESDADGSFTLAGALPHQERQYVSAELAGYRSASVRLATGAPGETRTCELVLEPEASLGTIHGRVTLNGEPVRATVHWNGPKREGYAWAALEGAYRLENVEPGPVALSVRIDGSSELRHLLAGHEVALEVTPGVELEQDFALTLAMAEISGSVRFEDGTPAGSLDVEIMGGRRDSKATTDEAGRYACEVPLQDRSYMLVVRFGGQPFIQRGVTAGTSGVDFVLPLFGELRYRAIEVGTELAVPHPFAHWRRPGEKDFRWLGEPALSPDASGWLHAPVPLGPIEVLASTDLHHWAFGSVVVGPDSEHVFELTPGHALLFELDPASGAWPVDHALVVVEPEAAPSLAAEVDRSGGCRWTYGDRFAPGMLERRRLDFAKSALIGVSGLVGRQLLLVFPADLVLEPAELVVDGPRPEPVTVRWRRK